MSPLIDCNKYREHIVGLNTPRTLYILGGIGLFWALLTLQWTTRSNVPVLDDFNGVLGFLSDWYEAGTLGERLDLLWSPHNEHRIVITRLVSLADTSLFGAVNFRRLATYALLGLGLCMIALVRILRQDLVAKQWWWGWAFGVAALVFRPEHWKHLLYPMANLQAIGAVGFSLLFIASIVQPGRRALGIAAVSIVLTILTNSIGLILIPLGLTVLMLQGRNRHAIWFLLGSIFVYRLYIGQGTDAGDLLGDLITHPFEVIRFALGIFGSSLTPILPVSDYSSVIAGAVIASFSAYVIVSSPPTSRMSSKLTLLFFGGTCCIIALGRAMLYDDRWPQMVLDGRYRIYSVMAVALLVPTLAERVSIKFDNSAAVTFLRVVVIAFSLVGLAASYIANSSEWRRVTRVYHNDLVLYLRDRDPDRLRGRRHAQHSVDRAISYDLYRPPPTLIE